MTAGAWILVFAGVLFGLLSWLHIASYLVDRKQRRALHRLRAAMVAEQEAVLSALQAEATERLQALSPAARQSILESFEAGRSRKRRSRTVVQTIGRVDWKPR
jgi:hypothetical protein